MNRGLPPYNDVANWDIINYLKAGRRLGKPEHCPASIYELMNLCWTWSPHERPTFSEILKEIHMRVEKIEQKRYERTIARNQVYVNVSSGPYYNSGTEDSMNDFGASSSSGFFSSGDMNSEHVSSTQQTSVNYIDPDIPTTDL